MSSLVSEMSQQDEWYCLTITGTAFLWRQVRCLMGFLFQVGTGRYQPSDFSHFLKETAGNNLGNFKRKIS
jgi:tRNA pseudouridine(38-40) synthase